MVHWNGLFNAVFIFRRFRLTLFQSFELIYHLFRCISSVTPIEGKYSSELNIQSHLTYLDLVIKEKIRLYLWFYKFISGMLITLSSLCTNREESSCLFIGNYTL